MNRLSNKILWLFAFAFTFVLNAQDLPKQEMLQFYPNNIGNSWSYWWIYHYPLIDYYEAGRDMMIVSGDTTIANLNYRVIEYDYGSYGIYQNYLESIDTATGDVFRIDYYWPGEMSLADNIYTGVGDTISITNNRHLLYCDKLVVLSLRDTVINNFQTTIREVLGLPGQMKSFYAKNIGFLGSGKNYWLDSANIDGRIFTNISNDFTGVNEDKKLIISDYKLFQNYPNPFNPATIISYSISQSGNVSVKIFNVLGKEIATLVSEEKPAGNYSVEFNAAELSGGVYFYQLRADRFTETRKMILLK